MNNDFMQSVTMQNFKTDNDGKVYYNSFTGEQFIGYSKQAYEDLQNMLNEALSKAEKYKQMLIDNGLLQEPMGQDEINNQILETLNNLSTQIKKLNSEVQSIKQGGNNEFNTNNKQHRKPKNSAGSETSVGDSEQYTKDGAGI